MCAQLEKAHLRMSRSLSGGRGAATHIDMQQPLNWLFASQSRFVPITLSFSLSRACVLCLCPLCLSLSPSLFSIAPLSLAHLRSSFVCPRSLSLSHTQSLSLPLSISVHLSSSISSLSLRSLLFLSGAHSLFVHTLSLAHIFILFVGETPT